MLKLAIIGTGGIVKEALAALREVSEIECTAIWAREHSRKQAESLAAEQGIKNIYTDYAALLQEDEADFVYIGLVNSAHYEYAKTALLAGKNVIVEKPFTSTLEEAQELVELARSRHLFLFEAITLLHLPNFMAIRQALPQIGNVRMVQCNFSQYSSRYDKYREQETAPAFNPELSGGALYDINIYNLHFVIALFGRPQTVTYTANIGFNGIDTSGVVVLRYQGFAAVCIGAKDSGSPSGLLIQGEDGYISVPGTPNALEFFTLYAGEKTLPENHNRYKHRMVHEFAHFAKLYQEEDYESCEKYMKHSLLVMECVVKARLSAGIRFAADHK
ncbi:MAG: Gfo/Idh/MocA family protein [Selenomonadaceae bacterium]|jgi:Predicted dehydrogenases and related proteins